MTNTTKFCPHCGNEVQANAKFCPKCGQPLTANSQNTSDKQPTANPTDQTTSSATSTQPNPSLERAKRFSGNFFSWWLATIRQPATLQANTHRYFGITAFLLEILVAVLTVATLAHRLAYAANSTLGSLTDQQVNFGGTIFKASFFLFIFLVLGCAIYVSLAYGFRKLLDINHTETYWDFTNRFASLTNLILIFNLIVFVLCLLTSSGNFGSFNVMLLFFSPVLLILNLGYIYSIIADVTTTRLDKFYTILLAEVALSLALFILFVIDGSLLGGSIGSYLEDFEHSFYWFLKRRAIGSAFFNSRESGILRHNTYF